MISAFIYSDKHGHYIPDPSHKPADYEVSVFLTSTEQERTEYPVEAREKLVCDLHPTYKGFRLARQCITCTKIYEIVKASGFKEKRG